MPDLHSLPEGWRPDEDKAIRNNGPDALVLERLKLRELAEGWPCYRYVLSILASQIFEFNPILAYFAYIDVKRHRLMKHPATPANGRISVQYFIPGLTSTQPGPAASPIRPSSPVPKQAWTQELS
jgi:hypothetical protein